LFAELSFLRDLPSDLNAFAQLCLHPVANKIAKYEDESWFEGLPVDRITQVEVTRVPVEDNSGNTVSVSFLVLPPGYKWPSFLDGKQSRAFGQSIILLTRTVAYPQLPHGDDDVGPPRHPVVQANNMGDNRLGVDDDGRLDNMNRYPPDQVPAVACSQLLRMQQVVFAGHPGVGKSMEVNIVLLHLLQEMIKRASNNATKNKQAKKFDVFLRIEKKLYLFCVENNAISCSEIFGQGENLSTLKSYLDTFCPNRAMVDDKILILELIETETDPEITQIPLILALSSRDVRTETKTMKKKGGVDYVIRPPHSPEALIALATALYQVCGSDFSRNLGIKEPVADSSFALPADQSPLPTSQLGDVIDVIRKRIQVIGPLAREVLNKEEDYIDWKSNIEAPRNANQYLNDVTKASVYKLPEDAKYFVAAYSCMSVRFLSKTCCDMVRKHAEDKHVALLTGLGLDWQIAEKIVLEYFVMKREPPLSMFWNYNHWEFFKNPDHERELCANDIVDKGTKDEIIKSAINHTRKVFFSHSWLPLAASELDPEAVYLSTMATMPVGEYLTIDKDKKRITLYLTSTLDPYRHPFMINSLVRYSQNGKVDIRILFFVPWHKSSVKGIRITEPVEGSREPRTLSDEEVCSRLYGANGSGRYTSFIVRCGIYDNIEMPTVLLQSTNKVLELERLLNIYDDLKDKVE
jgi:hypothetical protein